MKFDSVLIAFIIGCIFSSYVFATKKMDLNTSIDLLLPKAISTSEEIKNEEIIREHQRDKPPQSSEFDDLDADCKLLILEQLDLIDLINVASINKVLSILAANVYKRKFAQKSVSFWEKFSITKKVHEDSRVGDERIIISDFNVAKLVLKHFGSHISTLAIESKNHQVKQIVSLANEFCENLTKFYLETSIENALENVKNPFERVVDVGFCGNFNKIGNSGLDLNAMFPKAHRWFLGNLKNIESNSLNVNIPFLDTLDLKFSKQFNHFDKEIVNLITKNAQMKHIRLSDIDTSFIDFVSKLLPNLEILEILMIRSIDFTNEIHFNNVKVFTGSINKEGDLGRITFERLEELSCNSDDFPCFDFIRENSNLRKLSLLPPGGISNEDLSLIGQTATNLREVSFSCDNYIEVNTILWVLEEFRFLKKLFLNVRNLSQIKVEEIQNKVNNKWNLSRGDGIETNEMYFLRNE